MSDDTTNLWHLYGLRESPFFQTELRSAADSTYPPRLFVGRDRERKLIGRQILGASSSRTVIEGGAGVGKTSLVNRVKADLIKHRVLVHETPVRIVAGMSLRGLVAEVLKVLLRIRHIKGQGHSAAGARTYHSKRKRPALRAGEAFWTRVARLVEGEDLIGGGASIAGVGANLQRGRIHAEVPQTSLYDELAEALARLTETDDARVFIHVNNLESLSVSEAKAAAALLLDLRDYMLIDGGHWVFVGAGGIDSAVFRVFDQVGGIVPPAISLGPLNADEVGEMLELRYKHLARGRTYVPPVAIEGARKLYRRYHGDLRNFLRLLHAAANEELGVRDVKALSPDRILALMAPRYLARLAAELTAADFGHLQRMLEGASVNTEFRVADFAARTRLHQTTASQLVSRLVNKRVIEQSRAEGRSIYYRPSGDTGIALQLDGD